MFKQFFSLNWQVEYNKNGTVLLSYKIYEIFSYKCLLPTNMATILEDLINFSSLFVFACKAFKT